MWSLVGGNHHTGSEKVFNLCYAQRTIRYSVSAAIFYLEARRKVVKAIDHHIVVEMSAFNYIFVRYVIVAGDEPSSPDAKFRTRSGYERLFTTGDILSEQLDGPLLPASEL